MSLLYSRPRVHPTPDTLGHDPVLARVFDSQIPAAVLFPVSHAVGLSMIRCLQGRNIPILAVDFKPRAAGLFSNRVTSLLAPGLYDSEEGFASYLLALGERFRTRPVFFLGDDEDVYLSLRRSEEFSARYRLPLSGWDVVGPMVDKGAFYRRLQDQGFPCPKTWFADDLAELDAQAKDLEFPVILKPTFSTAFRRTFDAKARRFDDYDTLREYAARVAETGIPFIVQEFMPGGMGELLTFVAYSRPGGEVVQSFTGRKVHQFPPDFGTARLAESIDNPGLERLGRRLLSIFGYGGISVTEFKRCPDGSLKVIETNPRPGGWPERLAQLCGANVVLAAYQDAVDGSAQPARGGRFGSKWANLSEDLYYCARGYRLLGWPHEHRGLSGWLRDLRGLRTGAFFTWTDPVPGLVRTRDMIREFRKREQELAER